MISAVLRRMDVCRLTIELQSPYLKDVTLCADHEGVRIRYRGNDILRNFDARRNENIHGLVRWILREKYALRCCKSRRTHKHSNRLAELVDDSKYRREQSRETQRFSLHHPPERYRTRLPHARAYPYRRRQKGQ